MEEKVQSKMSYEELQSIATQLGQQNQHLHARLHQLEMSNLFKRLDYLFKVLENAPNFSYEFVESCASEIKEILTIPDSESTNN